MYLHLSKRIARNFGIVFGLMFLILLLPSLLPLQSESEKQAIVEQNALVAQSATVSSIFNNNLCVAVISLFPFLGWGLLGFILWNTGYVVAGYGDVVACLFLNPFVYVELALYSYVVLQSYRLWRLFRQRLTVFTDLDGKRVVRKTNGIYQEMGKTGAYTFIVVTVVLLVSAFVEVMLIRGVLF